MTDFFKPLFEDQSDIVELLAETMPDYAKVLDRFIDNWENKYLFSISKLTIASGKLKKLTGLKIDEDDTEVIISVLRNMLRHFCVKNKLRISYYLAPEVGARTLRLHFHGLIEAHTNNLLGVDKLIKWWRRNVGFANIKPYFQHENNYAWRDYILKQQHTFKPFLYTNNKA